MDGFLKIIGGAVFWLALAAGIAVALVTRGSGVAILLYVAPIILSGAAIYALGAILNNLIAIREASDRQAAALVALMASQKQT
jgi:hypothetical protein